MEKKLSTEIEKNLVETTETNSPKDEKKDIWERVIKVVKLIFLGVTSPLWFPWKVLFVRKNGHKFKDVSTNIKIFRIVRFPITKPIKFLLYLFIIGLEVLLVYKARYSILGYPLTKSAVENYYFTASEDKSEEYKESLKKAFDHLDDWDIDTKNKMYVIFDSEIVKRSFMGLPDETTEHVLARFSEDESFREDIEDVVSNVDNIVSRAIKEIPTLTGGEEASTILKPITSLGSAADYRAILDAAGLVMDSLVVESDLKEYGVPVSKEEIDTSLELIINYSQGMSLEEAYHKTK